MTSVSRLDNFGFLAVSGKDAQKFLQGYVTCDIQNLTDTHSAVGAICNIKGRMVTSFRIIRTEDSGYLLRMTRALVPVIMEFLKKYIVFSKATMQDLSEDLHCFGVMGEIDGIPADDLPAMRRDLATLDGNHVIRVHETPRFEIWTAQQDWLPAGADTVDAGLWQSGEIESGLAWVREQTSASFMPQMFNYHNIGGIDFDKGCYLGQEIVARMQHRGALSRKLYHGETSAPRAVGESLVNEQDKSVGTVVAAEGNAFLAVIQMKDDAVPAVPDCELRAIH